MSDDNSMLWRVMSDALADVDIDNLPHLHVGTNWLYIEILSEPFVVYRRLGYSPVVVVEEIESEQHSILFVSAKSLSNYLEPIRRRRGNLMGLNIKIRKDGEDRFSKYEVEELVD